MDWLIEQAKTASPFVAVFCLVVSGIGFRALWNTHLRDQQEGQRVNREMIRTAGATARALERIAAAAERSNRRQKP